MHLREIAVCAVALAVVVSPAAAGAQATGEIGGPPTMGAPLPFPPPHKKMRFEARARSEAIVIGVGVSPFGKVEIVGQDTNIGLCIFVDHLNRGSSDGTCGRFVLPSSIAVESENFETDRRRSRSLSELSGFMQPTVASVRAVASRQKGGKRMRKAVTGTVAVPSSDLLARLHQTTPFGFYAVDFRGCWADAKMKVRAFDAAGALLGSSLAPRPGKRFPDFKPCTPGSSFVGFGGGTASRVAVAP